MAFGSWLAEKAREELELLEAQHPTRFNYLKHELKSLISQPESCAQLLYCAAPTASDDDDDAFAPASAAPTQVSTNRKRKSEWSKDHDEHSESHRKDMAQKPSSVSGQRGGEGSYKKSCYSVEAAIRRAEACLERIQQVKQSLSR
ncbi:hypothetical protein Cni_G14743 [Canna indica]|uniref:Uncharacterized protein n=1 Tax=Canna indica TaxID=4628 RepID=A0AAQ3KIB5_9LILI|nr:hypothetical protein Cni_G14743 [Canna indica]